MTNETSPVVLVTGSGAPRVGRSIARLFASKGYRTALHANTSFAQAAEAAEEFGRAGWIAQAFQANVADEEEVRRLADEVFATYGRLDVLVNSAAIWSPIRLEDVTAGDVRKNFEVNTLGTFLCCREFGLRMAAQTEGGTIVNLGDWAVARPYLDYAHYFPSKGAIPALTRDFAVELAHRNVRMRVNAVLPGPVMMPLDLPAEERAAAIAGTLLKREGTPDHVAHAVWFLAHNDFVTGVCLPVDGGRTIAG